MTDLESAALHAEKVVVFLRRARDAHGWDDRLLESLITEAVRLQGGCSITRVRLEPGKKGDANGK